MAFSLLPASRDFHSIVTPLPPLLKSSYCLPRPAHHCNPLLVFATIVDWKSPAEIQQDAASSWIPCSDCTSGNGSHPWTSSLDWQCPSGKKVFHWPMKFYFLNRYFLLFALMGM